MTPVYEVKTKHTKEVLKDYINFKEAVTHSHVTFRLVMLGVCSLTLAFVGRDMAWALYGGVILGVLFLVFAASRKTIAVSKLAEADTNYQKQSELHFVFGESEFRVENKDVGDQQRLKYGEVEYMYADDKYYYVNTNNEDMHVLPKADFTLGSAADFYDFMMHKTSKDFLPVKLNWAMKKGILRQAWQDMEEERDKKASKK